MVPIAELNCTLNPLFIWISPLSSIQGTLNIICLSGSTKRSNIFHLHMLDFFLIQELMKLILPQQFDGILLVLDFCFTSSITCSTICFTFFSILISPFALLISLLLFIHYTIFWNINYSIL